MNYPVVYDKFETTFASKYGIAVLENASSVKIKEVLNGEYLLSFILPRNDSKWQFIQTENFVKVYDCSQKKDQLFRIRDLDEARDSSGKLTANVQCEHVYYDAQDCKFFPNVELIGQTPAQILTYALSGTRFTVGTVEITTLTDILLDKVYSKQIIDKLIENVGGELVKDNWTINLVNKRGSNTGVQFRYGKNQVSLKRYTDAKNVITRLYPYGKDGLQISGALGYIDSPLIDNYDRPKIGYIDYKDIEDPEELSTAAHAEWSTSECDGIDKPRVTYAGEFIELRKLKEFGDIEFYGLGDTVRVIDEGINADTMQRIMEYESYPYEPKRSTVNLSNTKPSVYKDNRPANITGKTITTSGYVSKITDSSNKINPGWFQNIKTKLKTLFNGGIKDAVMHKTGDIWVDNPDNPTKAMAILADGFAIANSKTGSGDWDWKTFGTADGFFVDLLVAGTLMLSDNLTVENSDGSLKITGSEISLTKIDKKNRIIINLSEGFKIQKNIGSYSSPVWDNVNYQDTDGNSILKGYIIASKFYGATKDSAFIEIGTGASGNLGDLKLFRGTGGGNYPIFSVYDDLEIIDMKAGLGVSSPITFISLTGWERYPLGEWDCSSAQFTNLYDGSSFYAKENWVSAAISSAVNTAIAAHIAEYHTTP